MTSGMAGFLMIKRNQVSLSAEALSAARLSSNLIACLDPMASHWALPEMAAWSKAVSLVQNTLPSCVLLCRGLDLSFPLGVVDIIRPPLIENW